MVSIQAGGSFRPYGGRGPVLEGHLPLRYSPLFNSTIEPHDGQDDPTIDW